MSNSVIIRHLGICDYQAMWQTMKSFTDQRQPNTPDEIWLLQHPPVFTQGQAGKAEHIHDPHDIPIVQTDRGGQVTYHGPGQLIAYTLIDLRRKQLTIRQFVTHIEQAIIALLKHYDIEGNTRCKAPGVYIADDKVASLGLRVRKGCAYHGLSLNVDMDLTPFSYINPCGFSRLGMTQLSEHINTVKIHEIEQQLSYSLIRELGYNREDVLTAH